MNSMISPTGDGTRSVIRSLYEQLPWYRRFWHVFVGLDCIDKLGDSEGTFCGICGKNVGYLDGEI